MVLLQLSESKPGDKGKAKPKGKKDDKKKGDVIPIANAARPYAPTLTCKCKFTPKRTVYFPPATPQPTAKPTAKPSGSPKPTGTPKPSPAKAKTSATPKPTPKPSKTPKPTAKQAFREVNNGQKQIETDRFMQYDPAHPEAAEHEAPEAPEVDHQELGYNPRSKFLDG